MNKITYLIGAGASANCIPLVDEIPERLMIYKNYIENLSNSLIPTYCQDISELIEILTDHNTIDSYARNLYQNKFINQSHKLSVLKAILSGLFLFEQLRKKNEAFYIENYLSPIKIKIEDRLLLSKIKRTVDPRYKNFIGKILNEKHELDERINIISWNYDIQLEIALEQIVGYKYEELGKACKIFPHPTYEVSPNNFFEVPQIVKLNGTAGIFTEKNKLMQVYQNQSEFFDDIIDIVLNIYKEAISRYITYNPEIKFAWEDNEYSKKSIEFSKTILEQTQVLVIIGYSFPDFNRSVDRMIFGFSNNIKEIYLQIPKKDEQRIRNNIKGANPYLEKNCQIHEDLRDFLIPYQF